MYVNNTNILLLIYSNVCHRYRLTVFTLLVLLLL